MWLLACKSSFFSDLFIAMPHLWTHWFLQPYALPYQDDHTVCAIRVWRYTRLQFNTSLPVHIYALSGSFSFGRITGCIPSSSLAFVRHITIRISESIFHHPIGFREFIALMPSLRDLSLSVHNPNSRFNGRRLWYTNAPLLEHDIPSIVQLDSLTLRGLMPHRDVTSSLLLRSITSLTLLDVASGSMWPTSSLVEIMSCMPLLRSLCVRSDDGQLPPRNFWPPPNTSISSIPPSLRYLELSGDAIHLYPFLNSVFSTHTVELRTVVVTFHLWKLSHPDIVFGSIPALEVELEGRVDVISVHGSSLSVTTERSPMSVVPMLWSCTWECLSEGNDTWVRLPLTA